MALFVSRLCGSVASCLLSMMPHHVAYYAHFSWKAIEKRGLHCAAHLHHTWVCLARILLKISRERA